MLTVVLPILNLDVPDWKDINSIAILDLSSYSVLPSDTELAFQITPPGYETINVPFTPGSMNVYKCSDLGITCGPTNCCPLPDGIWDVVYTVNVANQTETIEKTFIRVNNIVCSFQKAYCKIDMECGCLSEEQRMYKKQLDKVDLFINGAVSAANDCNNALAFRLYRKAETILNNLCCAFGLPTTSCNTCTPCATTATCSSCK